MMKGVGGARAGIGGSSGFSPAEETISSSCSDLAAEEMTFLLEGSVVGAEGADGASVRPEKLVRRCLVARTLFVFYGALERLKRASMILSQERYSETRLSSLMRKITSETLSASSEEAL